MEHLSEDIIKKAGIRFLKEYYKYRPRTGKTVTSYDQETEDGIITDGQFSFVTEAGKPFLATLEATSYDSRQEVLYSRQEKLLFWDSLAYSVFFSVIFFSLSHHYNWITINKSGWILTISVLIIILLAGYSLARYLISGFQRYRYIYAIEQFKKYHADEQWIVIADDVFESATDKNLKELKTQCVRNGFGLISVDPFEDARILITPSRQEVFGKTRATAHFGERNEYLKYSKTEKAKNLWNKMIIFFSGKSKGGTLKRYQRSFSSQYLLCLIGLTIISAIFYKEALEAPISYVDEKKYEQELSEKAKKANPETADFLVDSATVEPANKKVIPYLEEARIEEVSVPIDEDNWEEEIALYFDDNEEQYAEIYISTGEGKYLSYDCERFFNYSGTKYLIQEGTYQTVKEARKQLIRLKKRGINAHCLWTGCVNEEEMEFIVFIDFLFVEKREAGMILNNIRRRFQLDKGYLKIRSITL